MGLTYVSATLMAKDGMEADLEGVLAGLVDEVRREDGCIRYDLHKSDSGNVFFFYEIWESAAHLAAHLKTPHVEAAFMTLADMVTGPADVNTWEAVDVVGS